MNIKVDDQGAERESEPIAADVTGSMRRGLSYDPAEMLGPAVSVGSRDAAHQARMDALRLHLEQTHCNLAAAGLTNRDAVEYHHREHNGPGGIRLHDQPEQLHDWAWFGGVRSAVSVEHVGLPSPDAHAVASELRSLAATVERDLTIHGRADVTPDYLRRLADRLSTRRRAPLDRVAEHNPDPDAVEPEPLDVQISRILRRRDVAAVSHEAAVKLVLATFAARLPRPAGALDAEAWGEHEADHDRQPTSARYIDYLLAPRPTAVTLDQRLALGAILVEHRNRADDTAGAIDAILAALGLTADPPASHDGTTETEATA